MPNHLPYDPNAAVYHREAYGPPPSPVEARQGFLETSVQAMRPSRSLLLERIGAALGTRLQEVRWTSFSLRSDLSVWHVGYDVAAVVLEGLAPDEAVAVADLVARLERERQDMRVEDET